MPGVWAPGLSWPPCNRYEWVVVVLHAVWAVCAQKPLGIAIDWVVDRSSLGKERWLNVQSGHRKGRKIRAMPRAKRNAEKAAMVTWCPKHGDSTPPGVLGKGGRPRVRLLLDVRSRSPKTTSEH